jgi:hypothetical protein
MILAIPTEQQFFFAVDDDGKVKRIEQPEYDSEHGFSVTFRQGTTQDDRQITDWTTRRKSMIDKDGNYQELYENNPDYIAELEVGLTLCATDLQLPKSGHPDEGEDLAFQDAGGVRRIKNQAQFKRWWGITRVPIARAIYEACLEVNPDWGPKSKGIL